MAIVDFQMEYNGLVFGLDTDIGITDVTGFDDLAVALGDTPIPRGDGDVPGLARAQSRAITLSLKAKGEKRSEALAETILDAFNAFQVNDPLPLKLKDPGFEEVFVYARPIGRVMGRKATTTFGSTPIVFRLQAADPRIYASAERNQTIGLYDPSGGGLDYGPLDYGKDFVGAGSGIKVLRNAGNAAAFPLLRFYGPTTGTVTGGTLTNLTTGQTFIFTTTLLTGQILTADMRRMVAVDPTDQAYINLDGSNRYGDWALPREPFYFAPGDNFIQYEITGTSADAVCVTNHRDTWL